MTRRREWLWKENKRDRREPLCARESNSRRARYPPADRRVNFSPENRTSTNSVSADTAGRRLRRHPKSRHEFIVLDIQYRRNSPAACRQDNQTRPNNPRRFFFFDLRLIFFFFLIYFSPRSLDFGGRPGKSGAPSDRGRDRF